MNTASSVKLSFGTDFRQGFESVLGNSAMPSGPGRTFEQPEAVELFNNEVPVVVRVEQQDTKRVQLQIKIERKTQPPQNQQVLAVTVTDKRDPFFLYMMQVSEREFHALKSEQNLLVDFVAFPNSFIQLLKQCLQCQNQEIPKFVCVMNQRAQQTAVLAVQETNEFRHLQHIALQVKQGNDRDLKQYLAENFVQERRDNADLRRRIEELEGSLHQSQMERKQAVEHAQTIKRQCEKTVHDLKVQHAREQSGASQRHVGEQQSIREQANQEKQQQLSEHQKQLQAVQERSDKLHEMNRTLTEKTVTLEHTLKQTESRLSSLEHELQLKEKELTSRRSECGELSTSKFELEKTSSRQSMEIAALKQQVADKGELGEKISGLLDASKEQKTALEERNTSLQKNVEKNAKKVRDCVSEINKGNKIIAHLQNELRNLRAKVKHHKQLLTQRDSLEESKNKELKDLKEKGTDQDKQVIQLDGTVKELRTSLEATSKKLEEAHKVIESNQQVISWLNREMNQQTCGGASTPGTYSALGGIRSGTVGAGIGATPTYGASTSGNYISSTGLSLAARHGGTTGFSTTTDAIRAKYGTSTPLSTIPSRTSVLPTRQGVATPQVKSNITSSYFAAPNTT